MRTIPEWARRVGLAYLLIANAGFPFELVGFGPLAEGYCQARQWLVRTATAWSPAWRFR